jgi:hypothetical protein
MLKHLQCNYFIDNEKKQKVLLSQVLQSKNMSPYSNYVIYETQTRQARWGNMDWATRTMNLDHPYILKYHLLKPLNIATAVREEAKGKFIVPESRRSDEAYGLIRCNQNPPSVFEILKTGLGIASAISYVHSKFMFPGSIKESSLIRCMNSQVKLNCIDSHGTGQNCFLFKQYSSLDIKHFIVMFLGLYTRLFGTSVEASVFDRINKEEKNILGSNYGRTNH